VAEHVLVRVCVRKGGVTAEEEVKCKMRLGQVAFRGLLPVAPTTAAVVSRDISLQLTGHRLS
jgi:hypothetical protein